MNKKTSLSLGAILLLLSVTLVNSFDYTDAIAYDDCFKSYSDGELCNNIYQACQADA